jgi:hypothetical protein
MTRLDAETPNFGREGEILTPEAVQFLCLLQSRFGLCRQELLFERDRRQRTYDLGQRPTAFPL